MDDPTAISFSSEIRGVGELVCGDVRCTVLVFFAQRDKYAFDDRWRVTARLAPPVDSLADMRFASSSEPYVLRGITDDGYSIVFDDFMSATIGRVDFTGTVDGFDRCIGDTTFTPTERRVSVSLTNTGLLRDPVVRTVAEPFGVEASDPLVFNASIGELSLIRREYFEPVAVNGIASRVTVPRAVLTQVRSFTGDDSPAVPFDVVPFVEELEDICWVLSFATRSRIGWTELDVRTRVSDPMGGWHELRRTHRARYGARSERLKPLLEIRALGKLDLDALYQNYRRHPQKDIIATAIAFLVDSFDEGYLEGQIMSAFTALEAILRVAIEPADKVGRLPDKLFAQLKGDLDKALEATIADFASAHPDHADKARGVSFTVGKQPPGLPSRVSTAVNKLSIAWQDLWSEEVKLAKELDAARARRGALVHAGELTNPHASIDDYYRIHAITERLIFALLGGSSNWIHRSAYQHVRGLLPSAATTAP
jgi:hypothetical protein